MANPSPDHTPLAPLPEPREFVVGFMRGERSSFKAGYAHTNAASAAIDLCELRQIELTDLERLLLPCFALGVARGLGSARATLESLHAIAAGVSETDAIEAYNSGMIYGAWEKRLGYTLPADR